MYRTVISAMNHPDPFHQYMGLFNYRSIRSIASKGVETDVVVPRPFAPPFGPYSEFSRIPTVYNYETHRAHYPRFAYLLPQRLFRYTLSSAAFSHMLPEYVETNFRTPDVCHAGHIHYDGYGLLQYCEERDIPLTVMGRGKILNNYHEMSFLGKRTVRKVLNFSDMVLCVSESLARIARDIVDHTNVTVLPNGADPSRYPTERKGRLKAELGIPSETTVVLFCGGYTERKGVHEIIRALDEIHHDDVQLVFIGHYGDLRETLISSLEQSPHESYRVLWEVPPVGLRRWFAVADIFMLPSHAEGRPNTVYEAMASKTPVVATDVSGIPEQVVDDETGLLVPPRDPVALADNINKLIKYGNLRERMGEQGLKRLLAKDWTWEAHGDRLVRIHRSIIDGNR